MMATLSGNKRSFKEFQVDSNQNDSLDATKTDAKDKEENDLVYLNVGGKLTSYSAQMYLIL